MNPSSDNFSGESDFSYRRNDKKRYEENRVFTYFGLIFYCYLLIPVNELGVK